MINYKADTDNWTYLEQCIQIIQLRSTELHLLRHDPKLEQKPCQFILNSAILHLKSDDKSLNSIPHSQRFALSYLPRFG